MFATYHTCSGYIEFFVTSLVFLLSFPGDLHRLRFLEQPFRLVFIEFIVEEENISSRGNGNVDYWIK